MLVGANALVFAAEGAGDAPRPAIVRIDPPEKGFFTKKLDFHGVPIKSADVVADEALYAAYDRWSLLFSNINSGGVGSDQPAKGASKATSGPPSMVT